MGILSFDRDDLSRKGPLVYTGMDIDLKEVLGWLDDHIEIAMYALGQMREEAPETGLDPDDIPVELLLSSIARAAAVQAFLFGWELAQAEPS
jgi:hypothetical protein